MKFFMAKKAEISEKELKIKALLDKIESLLDNISPSNKEAKMKEFRKMEIHKEFEDPEESKEFISKVVDLVHGRALQHREHSEVYARFCSIQIYKELMHNVGNPSILGHSLFNYFLLNRLQNTFEMRGSLGEDVAVEGTGNENKAWKFDPEKLKQRDLNNVIFMANLYQTRILNPEIIGSCVFDLMKHTNCDDDGVYPEPPYNEDYLIMASHLFSRCDLANVDPLFCRYYQGKLKKVALKCSDKTRVVILKNLGVSIDETETEADDSKKKKSWLKALFSCGF